jgi:hypothetical protein
MSGPFGVNITVISGQNYSREIVVAASAFLSMPFLSIDPVATDATIRLDFLTAFNRFVNLEKIDYYEWPRYFDERVIQPSNSISTGDLFWLALDQEGESLAKSIFEANGESPNERVYHFVRKLNLIEQTIPSPPVRQPFWQNLFSRKLKHPESTSLASYQGYRNKQPRLTHEQILYYIWFEALYEALIPWMDIIKNIQSDFS